MLARAAGEPNAISALRAYLAPDTTSPNRGWAWQYDDHATIVDYLDPAALIVIEEPGMLETVERGLDEERGRGAAALLAGVDSGELDVRDDDVGEALLADVVAPAPRLADYARRLRERRVLTVTGGIEAGDLRWVPPAMDAFVLETRPPEHFNRRLELFATAVREWAAAGDTVWLVATGASRLAEILRGANIPVQRSAPFVHLRAAGTDGVALNAPAADRCSSIKARSRAASLSRLRLHVLGDREIFGQPAKRVKLRAVKEGVPVTLADLKVGDYIVHAVHGIAQYLGLRTETILGATSDYLDLKYAGTDRMLVPVHQMHQVTKYSATEGHAPRLSRMGGADWARTKSRVSENLAKIADGLVELYAEREIRARPRLRSRHALAGRTRRGFPLRADPDQAKAIDDTKRDMESPSRWTASSAATSATARPKSRCARSSKRSPTRNKSRSWCRPRCSPPSTPAPCWRASRPFRCGLKSSRASSRAKRPARSSTTSPRARSTSGRTHRILQKDVVFRDLGLIIVDEEQRFGVMHKERLNSCGRRWTC